MQQIRTLMAFQDSEVNQSFAIITHTDVQQYDVKLFRNKLTFHSFDVKRFLSFNYFSWIQLKRTFQQFVNFNIRQ